MTDAITSDEDCVLCWSNHILYAYIFQEREREREKEVNYSIISIFIIYLYLYSLIIKYDEHLINGDNSIQSSKRVPRHCYDDYDDDGNLLQLLYYLFPFVYISPK